MFRKLQAALCASALSAASLAASATIVDIEALTGATGRVLHLAAGTYDVRYVGIAGGGAYDAWNPWGYVAGCDGGGMNCTNGWIVSSAIDFGHGTGNFDGVDGYAWTSAKLPDDNRIYETPGQALASAQSVPKLYAPLAQAFDAAAYVAAPAPWQFTLAQAQDVKFFLVDAPYSDNTGGVSLEVAPVPLPASVVLLAPALLALRRRAR